MQETITDIVKNILFPLINKNNIPKKSHEPNHKHKIQNREWIKNNKINHAQPDQQTEQRK